MKHIIVLRIEADDPEDEYDDGDLYRAIEQLIREEVFVRGPKGVVTAYPKITSSSSAII